jgi:peroxiredoxin
MHSDARSDLAGRKVLLSFRRYAACPVCNQHLATFRVRAAAELGSRGIDMFTVFHSPIDRLRRYFDPDELPFEVLVDPEFTLYEAFGVTPRRLAAIHPGSVAAVASAVFAGQRLGPRDAIDGTDHMVPANFMIEDGRIVAAHYGKHLGDAWSVEQVIDVAHGLWGSSPAGLAGRVPA